MIILIDQDGSLADFEKGFLEKWRTQFPREFFVPLYQRKDFYIYNDYPENLRDKVKDLYSAPGFFLGLRPVEGSVEAAKTMLKLGYDVRICSSPLSRYENCVLEKYQWVEKHLGGEFTKRIILSKDKTLIRGNFLIDDNPVIEGVKTPEWEQVVYDCPYNRNNKNNKRLTWQNWRSVLDI